MSLQRYQIVVRDLDGATVTIFSCNVPGMLSFSYQKRLRTPGGWWVQISGVDDRIDSLRLDTGLNHIWEFWRRDQLGGLDWYRDFSGIHRYDEFAFNSDGTETYTARGLGFNDLLIAPIRYDKGTAGAYKDDAAETVAKEYVNENVGPAAAADRQLANFTVEGNFGTGNNWSGDRANKQLLDVLREIADTGPGDFMVVDTSFANNTPALQFQWRDEYWGLDVRPGNADGNPPVIFGVRYGNVGNIRTIRNRLEEINVIQTIGQGDGVLSRVRERTATDAGIDNTWDINWGRREVIRTTQDYAIADMDTRADDTLFANRVQEEADFTVLDTYGTRYGVSWDYGYIVRVEHREIDIDMKILGVTVSMNSNGEVSISPEVEEYID